MPLRKFSASRPAVEIPAASPLYLHGVMLLGPEEKRATAPFGMEERGIDGLGLVYAWDRNSLRCYFSVLPGEAPALPKAETIRLRGVHESILNDLRLHGTMLPFAFGTVARDWRELRERLAAEEESIAGSLHVLEGTRQWNLVISVLDARMLELQLNDTPEKRREADRRRIAYTSRPPEGKIDGRALQSLVARERQLAEDAFHALEPLADHAKLLSTVSTQSGFSADWKPILTASYEIRPSILHRFQRQVTDLQYQYLLQEPMVSLTGDAPSLVLPDKA